MSAVVMLSGVMPLRFDVNHAVLILQRPFDQQEAAARDDDAVALEDIGSKDDVGDAGFIFEREEDEALGRAGPLACDDATGDADGLMAGYSAQDRPPTECLRGASAAR